MDIFCKRYGWTYQEFVDTPASVIEELSEVIRAEAEIEQARARNQPLPAATHEETMRQARAAGFPMPRDYAG